MSCYDEEYEVEKILAKREHPNVHYLIKWKGWEVSESTWEPIEHLTNAWETLIEFERKLNEENRKIQSHYHRDEKEAYTAYEKYNKLHRQDLKFANNYSNNNNNTYRNNNAQNRNNLNPREKDLKFFRHNPENGNRNTPINSLYDNNINNNHIDLREDHERLLSKKRKDFMFTHENNEKEDSKFHEYKNSKIRSKTKETIIGTSISPNEELKEIKTVKIMDNRIHLLVEILNENKIKKEVYFPSEVLAQYAPEMIIDFYENKIKFV